MQLAEHEPRALTRHEHQCVLADLPVERGLVYIAFHERLNVTREAKARIRKSLLHRVPQFVNAITHEIVIVL